MTDLNHKYDFIIYGAGIWGAAIALKLIRKKYKVLITNRYGFPGGIICESLFCHQKFPYLMHNVSEIMNLYIKYAHNNFNPDIIEPESFKYALQKSLSDANINAIFHVLPVSAEIDNGEMEFYGREGKINIKSNCIIDASETAELATLSGLFDRQPEYCNFNYILKSVSNAVPQNSKYVRINNDLYWTSLKFECNNIYTIENKAHEIYTSLLKSSKQVVLTPPQSAPFYKIQKKSNFKTDKFICLREKTDLRDYSDIIHSTNQLETLF